MISLFRPRPFQVSRAAPDDSFCQLSGVDPVRDPGDFYE
jgi:hypothetical protein